MLQMNYISIIIVTFFSGVAGTGLGGVIGAVLRRDSDKTVSLLLSFAAGIMLAVVCFDLMSTPVEMMKAGALPFSALFFAAPAVFAGYVLVCFFNYIIDSRTNREVAHIDKTHPATADNLDELIHSDHMRVHKKEKRGLFAAGLVMLCAIALHNVPEGMVIGTSYAEATDASANLFSGSGFITAVVIGLHNVPEGMAVSVPLVSGGMGRIKAVLLTLLSGVPTVLGAVLGYAIGGINVMMLVLSLGFASGAMLYVVFGELLPEAVLMWKSKVPAFSVFLGVLTGFLLVLF
ncbi:MAG: ZIP family metal transporter [Bacteroides sp.]|nr:ZIP family metal transporter [Prevotella sp.]MCM1407114.1 ZIP family metal transporter [Treponema brennaborense]MCM1470266.1 ZIP family metal transporter [Bacteroides sp.]